MAPALGRPGVGRFADWALGLVFLIGAIAWGIAVVRSEYTYDEFLRAHSLWLTSKGLLAYRDFFECHPPYFALLTPLIRVSSDPFWLMLTLRLSSTLANLAFLGGIAALTLKASPDRRWGLLALAAVAFHPAVLDYLIEFRADAWGYALCAWALVLFFRRRGTGGHRQFELGLLSGLATMIFCPKLTTLPALVVLADLVLSWTTWRAAFRAALGYALGTALAVGVVVVYVLALGVEPRRAFDLLIDYHVVHNKHSAFGHGLLREVVATWTLSAFVVLGAVVWIIDSARRQVRPRPFESAVLVWLVLQAIAVSYPHKQYYAPWFLFAVAMIVPLSRPLSVLKSRRGTGLFVLASGAIIVTSGLTAYGTYKEDRASVQCVTLRLMEELSLPDDPVVASLPLHPITRRDSLYIWFFTWDPGGYRTEEIFATMPSTRALITIEQYRAELEARPPAYVVISGRGAKFWYTARQKPVLGEFLSSRGYRRIAVGGIVYDVRPDRIDLFRAAIARHRSSVSR